MPTTESVVSCISKPSENRSDEEIKFLVPWLSKQLDKLNLKDDVLYEILKKCSYSEKVKNDVIIRQGDKGDCCYLLISGVVSIFVNTEAVQDDPEDSVVSTGDEVASKSVEETAKSTKKEIDRAKFGNCVAKRKAGEYFGELALINADCIRNASIIADETIQLLVINRALYNRSMKESELAELNKKVSFIHSSPLFINWLSRYRKQAVFSLRKEKFGFNDPIVLQGNPTNGLIFMLEGQAKVVVDAIRHETQFPSLSYIHATEDLKNVEINDIERSTENDPKRQYHAAQMKRLNYLESEQRLAQRNIEICIISNGEIIGDLEQGLELSTYTQSVIAIEPTVVYVLDDKNFERLINTKRNPKTVKLLRTMAINKVKYRAKMVDSIGKMSSISFYSQIGELIRREEEEKNKQMGITTSNKIEDIIYAEAMAKKDTDAGHTSQSLPNGISPEDLDLNVILSHRGPLIDMFGPGSVFYRNRILRQEKKLTELKKKHTEMSLKGQSGIQRNQTMMPNIYSAQNLGNMDDDETDQNFNQRDLPKIHSAHVATKGAIDKVIDIQVTIDWETTSERLKGLESRIRQWLASVALLNTADIDNKSILLTRTPQLQGPEFCATLKRFSPLDPEKKIIPGKKIFLKPKKLKPILKAAPINAQDNRDQVFITARPTSKFTSPADEQNIPSDSNENVKVIKSDLDELKIPKHVRKKNSDSSAPQIHQVPSSPTHQYSSNEYKELKQLLKKKKIEMQSFQTTLSI